MILRNVCFHVFDPFFITLFDKFFSFFIVNSFDRSILIEMTIPLFESKKKVFFEIFFVFFKKKTKYVIQTNEKIYNHLMHCFAKSISMWIHNNVDCIEQMIERPKPNVRHLFAHVNCIDHRLTPRFRISNS